jgi:hypothetical protein
MSYVTFDMSNPAWERFDRWLTQDQEFDLDLRNQENQNGKPTIIQNGKPTIISVSIDKDLSASNASSTEDNSGKSSGGWEFVNLSEWDSYDFVLVIGTILMLLGFVLALFPSLRAGGILFPIGTGLMACAAYAARRRDSYSS